MVKIILELQMNINTLFNMLVGDKNTPLHNTKALFQDNGFFHIVESGLFRKIKKRFFFYKKQANFSYFHAQNFLMIWPIILSDQVQYLILFSIYYFLLLFCEEVY